MNKKDYIEFFKMASNEFKSENLAPNWLRPLRLLVFNFKRSAFSVYRPTIMNFSKVYHQYQKEKYEKLINGMPASANQTLKEDLIEKYETHDFALTFGRAYGKDYREWCFNKIKEEKISAQHQPFLIWSGELNPKHKTFLKHTNLTIISQGVMNLLYTSMMLSLLLLTIVDNSSPFIIRFKIAVITCVVTFCGWTFYNPYSIGLYKVAKNYSPKSYKD